MEKREGGVTGRAVSSALLGALGTRPGSGGCHGASPFHQLLQANSSQHFGGSLSNFLLGTFNVKLVVNQYETLQPPIAKISWEFIAKSPHIMQSKLSPGCIQRFLQVGMSDLYLGEYLDCRRFV